jgi:hypothetical protein
MRSIRFALAALILCSPLLPQNWKYGPIPPAAAEVITALPGQFAAIEDIKQNYVAAVLPLHNGINTILVEGHGPAVCGAANCPA